MVDKTDEIKESDEVSKAAAILGRAGGRARSPRKSKSCRENGKKARGHPKGRR